MLSRGEQQALDRVPQFKLGLEDRFPLDLTATPSQTWEAYELSLREIWDPEDEAHWVGFDAEAYNPDDRAAAALIWSHRAWVDFTAIAESEAVLVRVCLEPNFTPDLKYCLSMRAVERARSTDLAHILATHLGSYQPSPLGTDLVRLLDGELVRRALHGDSDVNTYIAAHLVAQASIDLEMWRRGAMTVDDPLASLMGFVVRDKARMVEVAWRHLDLILPDMAEAGRQSMAEGINAVLREEEARGRQVPALLASGADRDNLIEAHARAAGARLGGVAPDDQPFVFANAVDEVAKRLAGLGIVIEAPQVLQP